MSASIHLPAPRVLVVDDDRDTVESTAMLFELAGAWVDRSFSGSAAIELARATNPDLILLDLAMPGVDGYALARALENPALPGDPLLVAVSTDSSPEDKSRAAQAGFDLHLVKPVDFAVLEHALTLCRKPRAYAEDYLHLSLASIRALKQLYLMHTRMGATLLQLARNSSDDALRSRRLTKARKLRETIARQLETGADPLGLSPLDLVLNDVIDRALAIAGTTMCTLHLSNPDGTLEMRAHRGVGTEFVECFTKLDRAQSSPFACAACEQIEVEVEDIELDPRYAAYRAIARGSNVRAVYSLPLIAPEGELVGVLATHIARPHRVQFWQREAIRRLARQAAAGIVWAQG